MEETLSITVLRTDASRVEVTLPVTATLNNLKDEISRTSLGPIEREHQRLFHLGREMKSGGRSLGALGLGKHNNFLVHLHSTKPKTLELSSDEDDDAIVVEGTVPGGSGEKRSYAARPLQRGQSADVVNLLEDDSDDDDIAIVETVPASEGNKRRRVR
eukprot:CAMPEP_0113556118 /NCGR_PEP_ID=MMETSP0015_2-20120614/17085_1 /TAXON_ID=2838 /ORGANISM="Odontella" /LENGTH=157 /DNA_ID=CAMNT_0000457451 /DNA_START=271 /DNA_END=744 /DNA_ORIENTATION=+ /assembly_acc=CAM_ASM_000160